jgi:hypothetical protein
MNAIAARNFCPGSPTARTTKIGRAAFIVAVKDPDPVGTRFEQYSTSARDTLEQSSGLKMEVLLA